MKKIFICGENFNDKVLYTTIKNQSPFARKFVIVDANFDNPVKIFSDTVFNLGCNQPQKLLIANQAITYGAIDPEEVMYNKFCENRKEGICIIISKDPQKVFSFFEKKENTLEVEIVKNILQTT